MNDAATPFYLFAFILGAMVGSFLNVCIVRLPRGESIMVPGSRCPECKAPIPLYDNIPLLSYILLRGRCRFCRTDISPRYFLVELATAVLALSLLQRFGLGFAFLVHFIFVAALIVVTFIDLEVRIVPDVISLPGIGLGLFIAVVNRQFSFDSLSMLPSPMSSFLGAVIGGGSLFLVAWSYQFFTGREGMGGGDVKLLAMMGAFLGLPSIPVILFFASCIGSLAGLLLILKKGVNGKYALPFAPFLCIAALLYLFFGRELIALYLRSG